MVEFNFAKGNDVVISLDDIVLGGVSSAVCYKNTKFVDIMQFLTDVPVHRTAQNSYIVTLMMNFENKNPFENSEDFVMKFSDNSKTVEYLGCFVSSIESKINAVGAIEDIVTVSAKERIVNE